LCSSASRSDDMAAMIGFTDAPINISLSCCVGVYNPIRKLSYRVSFYSPENDSKTVLDRINKPSFLRELTLLLCVMT
jgi:hypothetical protein